VATAMAAAMAAAMTAVMTAVMTTMMKEKDLVAGGQGYSHEKCEDENLESTRHETPPIGSRYLNLLFTIHRNTLPMKMEE
jgi:hypothetical protein